MIYCVVCHARLNFCSPDIFVCPTGHYALRVTMSEGERLSYTSSYTPDASSVTPGYDRTPIHPWYYEAFKDAEVWKI